MTKHDQSSVPRVVIVNDDRVQLRVLAGFVKKPTAHVEPFTSAEEALSAMDPKEPPDLIVTDLYMPGIDGWRFCRLLRSPEYAAFNPIPILVVSATFAGDEASRIAADLGANAFLPAPVDGKRFLEKVQALLKGDAVHDRLRVLIVEDSQTLSQLLKKAFEAQNCRVDVALTLKEGWTAFQASPYDAAVVDYHLPDGKGDALLVEFRRWRPECTCIMMTSDPSSQLAVAWMKMGAAAYLHKPFETEYLMELIRKVRRERALLRVEDVLELRTRELRESEASYKKVSEAISKSRQRLQHIIDFLPDATFVIDTEGKVLAWNRAIEAMTGVKAREMVGKGNYEYAIPFYGRRRPVLIDLVGKWDEETKAEYQYVKKEGDALVSETFDPMIKSGATLWNTASLLYDENGGVVGAVESIRDITERKAAEEALRKSEERYRSLFEQSIDAIVITSGKGDIIDANEFSLKIFGYSKQEMTRLNFQDLYCQPDDGHRFQEAMREKGTVERFEARLRRKNGTEMACVFNVVCQRDEENHVSGYQGIIRDITQQKEAEEALRESEQKYRELIENLNEVVYSMDEKGTVTYLSPGVISFLGYRPEEIIGQTFSEFIHPEDRKRMIEGFRQVVEGTTKTAEYRLIGKWGDIRWGRSSSRPIIKEGRTLGIQGVLIDITKSRRLQLQLHESQKMEAIATLAGGIAHQFNNALTPILGNVELLEMDYGDDERTARILRQMKASSHRMAHLTEQLLAYARGGKYRAQTLSLRALVADTVPLVEHTLRQDVRVETDLPLDIFDVRADPTQMQMALTALIANSNEAMQGPGRIRLEARNMDLRPQFVREHPELKPGPHICLTVEDTGRGMDEETLNRIFDPFFTTHFLGRGLGMAAVYGIIANHHGAITVDSEEGRGTRVRIYLPAIDSGDHESGRFSSWPVG